MRAHGLADGAAGLGVSDHLCWVYGSDKGFKEFRSAAVDFLADGLALNQRCVYTADRDQATVLADLAGLGDLDGRCRRGEIVVRRTADAYAGGGPVADPEAQLAVLARGVERATDAGFQGIRAVVEDSPLVADPAWCDAQVAWEQLVDDYMATHRLTAMCGYDRRVTGDDTAAAVACVHPLRHDRGTTFSLWSTGDRVCVTGEIDAFQAPLLERALATLPARDELVLDMTGVSFFDASAVSVLARRATRSGASGTTIQVRGARPLVQRLWDLLGFSTIRSLRFQ
jgi:anti-anti-sigma factor